MEIATRKKDNAVMISVTGRIDMVTAPAFEKSLSDEISAGVKRIILNFSALEYISSIGLRVILTASKKLKEQQGELVFAGLQGPVNEVFKISGFHSLYKMFESEEAALQEM